MKTQNTFYLRQLNDLALAFSIATALIMTAGVLSMLVLFPPSAHEARGAGGDLVAMQAVQPAPDAPAN